MPMVLSVSLSLPIAAATASLAMATSLAVAIPPLQPRAGEPITGLTPSERAQFDLGKKAYTTSATASQGLGPAFNGRNCAACHEVPIGGWGGTTVEHFGRLEADGSFDFLTELGGPVRQRFAISPGCTEQTPAQANHIRQRVTPSTLAFGLVEALTDEQLAANADPDDANGDGVSGRVHMVRPLEAAPGSPLRAGRFGWKAQIATVLSFSGDAAATEMGITNRVVPHETAPNGDPIALAACDLTADPEDTPASNGLEFVDAVTAFQRYLSPPPQTPRAGMTGEAVFNAVGCAACHTPSFTTPDSPGLEAALRGRTFRPYSDFLLHDMGDMLADGIGDGIPDGDAGRFEMKTPPLWNLRTRPAMLHDGSASDPTFEAKVLESIARHGGEGSGSRAAFNALGADDRAHLLAFLRSLGRDEFDIDGNGIIDSDDYALLIPCSDGAPVSPDDACAAADINGNRVIDDEERDFLAQRLGIDTDCNQNGVPDNIDIITGVSRDDSANGVPDECDALSCDQRVVRITAAGGAIADNTPDSDSVVSSIPASAIPEPGILQKTTVGLQVRHTWLSDLRVTLQRGTEAPKSVLNGTICTDCERFAADLDGTYFFGSIAGAQTPCTAPATAFDIDPDGDDCTTSTSFVPGNYRTPIGSSWFGGGIFQVQSGWTLRVRDGRPDDTGTLDGWILNLVYVPDSDPDCDGDGFGDRCAIADGFATDEDRDGLPDACEIAQNAALDCDGDGRLDAAEIADGSASDCNGNGRPDGCDPDGDGDGVIDACDECPTNPGRVVATECGCGDVVDSDGDRTPDCVDFCPNDPLKVAPGVCGCGVRDGDDDGDGTPNCRDDCPADPAKTTPGVCGCGTPDGDSDADGVADCLDLCPNDPAKSAPGQCGCGAPDTDGDADGVADCVDNCPTTANGGQADCDSDGTGDACTPGAVDCNANGIPDGCDIASGASTDTDSDGIPDECNNDCNLNGLPDDEEIAAGTVADCTLNGRPDSCDIAAGLVTDLDGNGVPDSCPGEFIVGGSGFASIQDAVAAAPAGTIVRISGGTYVGPIAITAAPIELRAIAGTPVVFTAAAPGATILRIEGAAAAGSVLDGIVFTGGSSAEGGALALVDTSATVRRCTFRGNAADNGGAVSARGLTGTFESCVFDANTALHDGGALRVVHSDLAPTAVACTACDFTGNTAGVHGGAVSWSAALGDTVRFSGCGVFGNTDTVGALALLPLGPYAVFLDIADSRLCGNAPAATFGPVADGGGNIFGTDCDGDGVCDSEEIAAGTEADCNGNQLPDACDIAAGESDCNQNGVPDACDIASGASADADLDGKPDECFVDCNANEVPDTVEVAQGLVPDCNHNGVPDACDIAAGTVTDYNGNGIPDSCPGEIVVGGSGLATIQEAIALAPAGTTIWVGPGSYAGPLSLTTKRLTLRSVDGAAATVISGAGLDTSTLTIRNAATAGTVIDGFRFVDGPVGTAEFGTRLGGAILMINTSADILRCEFVGNTSTYGGAIYAYNYSGTIEGCRFEDNRAHDDAGAVQLGFGGTFAFRDNALAGNSCGRNGGALQVVQWFDGPVTAGSISGCSFTDNESAGAGPAISWYAGIGTNLVVSDCTVEGNLGGTGALTRLATSSSTTLAFALSQSRFCRNLPRDVDGPVVDLGGNIFSADCNGNGLCDAEEIARGLATDCNGNGTLDACDLASGAAADCNGNGRPDSCDIAAGSSTDLDGNGRLDECSGEFVVGGSGYPTMQAAVNAAPASGATVSVGPGTYTGMSVDLSGKSVTLRSIAGPAATILDGTGLAGPIVRILDAGADGATITGFTFRNGSAGEGVAPNRRGGAIFADAGSADSVVVNIYSCVFESNSADLGGAVYGRRLVSTVQACDFRGNDATLGGALFLEGGSWVVRVTSIAGGTADRGGAIYANAPITGFVTLSSLSDNSAGEGSAIYFAQTIASPLVVTNSQVEFNTGAAGAALQSASGVPIQIASVRFCGNEPADLEGPVTDLGFNTFSSDCNGNGICDAEELQTGLVTDCNGNGLPDSCDIDAGAPDINGNGAIDDCERLGDIDGDGFVGAADLALMLTAWGSSNADADLSGDGLVSGQDIAILLQRWGL
jgi:CxxC motif-containing protein (DUF1111 family)